MAKNRRPARKKVQQAAAEPAPSGIGRRKILLGSAALSLLGVAGYSLVGGRGNLGQPAGDAFPERWQGNPNAPISMISYISFTCIHCADFHINVWPGLKQDYVDTGKVRHLLREVAFDQYGFWAAMVARRGGPATFHRVSDLLLSRQASWTVNDVDVARAKLVELASEAGMVPAIAQRALEDVAMAGELHDWIDGNVRRDGINATPSFIIDGRRYGNMSREGFDQVFERLIP